MEQEKVDNQGQGLVHPTHIFRTLLYAMKCGPHTMLNERECSIVFIAAASAF